MNLKKWCVAVAAFGVLCAPVVSAVPNAQDQAVADLQVKILADLFLVPAAGAGPAAALARQRALRAAIANATLGQSLGVIDSALCGLRQANLANLYGANQPAITRGEGTRSLADVQSELLETCRVAQLALASYGATGGVAGGAPGQTGGGTGAPGGGGGSNYIKS